jgi:hypothetical protein
MSDEQMFLDSFPESAYRVLFSAALNQERCGEVAQAIWAHNTVKLDWNGMLLIEHRDDDELRDEAEAIVQLYQLLAPLALDVEEVSGRLGRLAALVYEWAHGRDAAGMRDDDPGFS